MTNEEFIILAEKVAEGSASISEIALFNAGYESFQQDPQSLKADGLDSIGLKKESLARFWKNRDDSKRVIKLWPGFRIKAGMTRKVAAAAVAAVVAGVGIWFFSAPRHPDAGQDSRSAQYSTDIAPGKNGATITMANGKVIALSDAKSGVVVKEGDLKYNDGAAVSGGGSDLLQDQVAELTASTAKGQTYQFTLPDGTKVWLNADSKLEFPSSFVNSKTRSVKLSGEGYFEVAKDKSHPFMVATDKQEVEVLGTHFNINSYADEVSIKTTLLEGSVRINTLPRIGVSGAGIVIHPGEQATLNAASGISVKRVDADAAIDWKEGVFVFDKAGLDEIMKKVARWYDVEVADQRAVKTALTFSGRMSRYDNISKVLSKLALTGEVQFKIEGKKILIK